MKKIVLLMTCLLACGISFAQKLNKISGKITDDKGEAVANVMVKLFALPDTNITVKSIQSNLAGLYLFDQVKPGIYRIAIDLVGYKAIKSSQFILTDTDLVLPNYKLENLTKQLNEVVIQAKKPFIEHRIDKTVLNVENSIVASGSTVLEVLEKAPGVSVDRQNDQIKLNNKAGTTIMIDGKTNFLSGTDIATLLGNMSSDQIATIEIITNPSSKYDAAGNAGIINIKLKRNKAYGTNGTLSFNSWLPIMPNTPSDIYRAGTDLNLNHRVEKWNIYGNAAFNRKANLNYTVVDRATRSNELTSVFNQNFNRTNKGQAYMAKIGADYFASAKTTIGFMIDANTIATRLNNLSQTFIKESQAGTITNKSVYQNAYSKSPFTNVAANFNIKHDFEKEGTNLTFDADYSSFSNQKDEQFEAKYLNQEQQQTNATLLRNNTNADIDIYAAKTDFTLPISKTLKLETGLKSSYVKTDNDFLFAQYVNNSWQPVANQSNHFIYKENINAAYLNLGKEWEKWQIQIGLRAEHTHSNGNSITDDKVVTQNYLSLFPTVFVNQKLNADHNIRYSYSRRVDRPNYQQLNPFAFYLDPYAVDQGNPYLKAQFTDNFQLGYSYKQISISFNYADTRDLITQISQVDDVTRIVNVIRKNLGRARNLSANINLPIRVAKWWDMQYNMSAYYNKFEDGNLEGAAYNDGGLAYNFYTSQSFKLPKNFSVEISSWANSPRIYGVEKTTIWQFAVNVGMQKSMLNKKLKLRVNIDDIFLNNYWRGKLDYQNVNLQVVNRYTSRRANFSISYSFGNQNVKSARNRNTATDDIKNRVGGN